MHKRVRRNIQMDSVKAIPRLGPMSYCAYAMEYLNAARAASTRKTRFQPAQAYLACHAIELALIAHLSSQTVGNGQTEYELRTRNLWSLFEAAESHGLVKPGRPTPAQRSQVKKAARYYSQAVFEYPSLIEAIRGHPNAPEIRTLLAAAATLVAAAGKAVGGGILRTREHAARRQVRSR